MHIKILILSLFLVCTSVFCQKRTLKQAEVNYKLGYYLKALKYYEKYLIKNPDKNDIRYKECICKYQLSRFDEAQACFDYIKTHDTVYPASLNYFLAKTYRFENETDSSLKYFYIYLTDLKKKKNVKQDVIETAHKEFDQALNAKHQIEDEFEYAEVLNMGHSINSKYPDYAPLVSNDGKTIIFTSCRPDTKGGIIEDNDGHYHEDIYISKYNDSLKQWSTAKQINEINTVINDAAVSLSADGKTLILYRHDPYDQLTRNSGDLYISIKVNEKWTEPQPIDAINSDYWETSATISSDGSKMVFASNRPGGKGGLDLYVVTKLADGSWSLPVPLSELNTSSDDDSPYFLNNTKTLFFSSKGYDGIGGYDVFYSNQDNMSSKWSKPEHLPYPINTTNDDLYFSWNKTADIAYVSSLRKNGEGDKDIYMLKFKLPQNVHTHLSGFVIDQNYIGLEDASIKVKNLSNGTESVFYTGSKGKYKIWFDENSTYIIEIKKEGYIANYQMIKLEENNDVLNFENDIVELVKIKQ